MPATEMNNEQLIELVRQHEILYDLSHPKYMDSTLKLNIWNEIGKALKANVSSCKSRWNNIRDNYRKSMRKTATKSRQNAKKIKVYKYSEQLSFLKKYFDKRETKGNIEKQDDEDDKQYRETQDEYEVENRTDDTEEPNVSNIGEGLQSRPPFTSTCKNTFEAKTTSWSRTSKKRVAPQQTASAKLMEYLIKKNENHATTNLSQHPVDAFLAGVAPTLKTLNPYFLNIAKSEIFAIAQRYEMKMLMEQHSYQGRYDQNITQNITPISRTPSSVSTPLPSLTETFLDQESVKFHNLQPVHEISSPPVAVQNSITENALQN